MNVHSMLASPPEAILFDADGTLYESERLSFEASRITAQELYDFDLPWQLFSQEVIRGTKTTPELLESQGIVTDPAHIQARKAVHYERIVAEELQPMPGLYDFLQWCEEHSIAGVVVSSNRRRAVDLSLQALGIADFFQGIVTREDVTDRHKPHPYAYQLGLQLAGIASSRALAIEDTAKGITSARAADLRCIGIRNETNSESDLAIADVVISDYRQLIEIPT